jgi:hypothetical protein
MKTVKISLHMDITHQYVREQLRDGNTLAQLILQKIPMDKGRYFALLNPLADQNKIYNFRSGGILPQNSLESVAFGGKLYPGRKKAHSVLQLAEYLKNIMESRLCCYFEDQVHHREDPIASEFKTNTLYYQEEPYLFLQNIAFSIERAVKMIHYTDAQWYYMNIVSKEEPGSILDISNEKLQKIALGTTCIVLGAYDMEGFIVWENDSE